MPRPVIVVGDANVDIVVHYPHFLDANRKQVVWKTPEVFGGGTSSNTAAALGKLGQKCEFVGSVGNDANGRFVAQDLLDSGVLIDGMVVEPDANTVGVFAFIDERGERYLWGWPRNNQAFKLLDPSKVDFDNVRRASWLHSSGMSLVYDTSARSTIIEMFKVAYEAGVPTSFDLNLRVDDGVLEPNFKQALEEILPYVSHLLGSGPDEFVYLGDSSWEHNAESLATPSRKVIARDGERGSIAFFGQGKISVPAYRVEVADTVGAGDIFNAGYILASLKERGMKEALEAGNAISAYSIEHSGARNTPTLAQLEEFKATHSKLK
jgi:sugar/nucleoside kinase (ribokinase family)